MKFRQCLILLLLLLCAALSWGQSAADVERLLESPETTCAEAAWFVLAAQMENPPTTPNAAFALAVENGYLPKKAESGRAITSAELSLLVMRAFKLEGGLMYRLFHGTRYAYREMARQGLVEGRSYPHSKVSGEQFLGILGMALSRTADDAPGETGANAPQDFGFIISQKAAFTNGEKSSGNIGYLGTLIPWAAVPLGEKVDLYFSGGISAEYDNEEWKPIPEIYRTEIIYSPFPYFNIEFGRLQFSNCLPYTMNGLFDGVLAHLNLGGGRLDAGVFYTGLLYKNSSYILMSTQDNIDYLDGDRYFASRRLVSAVNWEYTGIFDTWSNLSIGGVFQFDLNDADTTIHSQYLGAKLDMPLASTVNTEWGFVVELVETGSDPYAAFALSADIQWLLPTSLNDRLSVAGYFASGSKRDGTGAFVPVTSQGQGKVLRPVLSGIALAQADYAVQLHRSLLADLFAAYYFRTDTANFYKTGIDLSSKSPLVGAEIYGSVSWLLFSDISLSAGGGVFLPQTGKVFSTDAPIYRVELAANISL